jgi:hypothetical protein
LAEYGILAQEGAGFNVGEDDGTDYHDDTPSTTKGKRQVRITKSERRRPRRRIVSCVPPLALLQTSHFSLRLYVPLVVSLRRRRP